MKQSVFVHMGIFCRHLIILLCLFLVFGCAADYAKTPPSLERSEFYVEFFKLLDQEIDKTGVGNASTFPVPGFPNLRTDWYYAKVKDRLKTDEEKNLWLNRLKKISISSRKKEIVNLPESSVKKLSSRLENVVDRQTLMNRMEYLSESLFQWENEKTDYFEMVKKSVHPSDDYSTVMRIFGLYPLVSIPVAALTYNAYEKFRYWHKQAPEDLDFKGKPIVYKYKDPDTIPDEQLESIFSNENRDILGLPRLTAKIAQKLVTAYAPVIVQKTGADYDRIGKAIWKNDRVEIDIEKPVLYYYFTYGHYKEEPILQINYSFWYPARKGPQAPLIEHGRIDGITLRISLKPNGRPFMTDIMNNCGCYHFFAPNKSDIEKAKSKPLALDPLAPVWMPETLPESRLKIFVNASWHQTYHMTTDKGQEDSVNYTLLPYYFLEILKKPDGSRESIFDENGIVKGSERIEPYLLFSMGIPDVGSMRQRGNHALKLVGKQHFQDPDIFNKNFIYQKP